MRAPIGLRIRNTRKLKGISQAALARAVEISPSYLNLIEANKRDVGGSLLHRIARELDISLNELTGESELRLISEIQEAFADPIFAERDLSAQDAHQLVAGFPRIAWAFHVCYRAFLDRGAAIEALTNRLQSDPLFSQLLHQMLSRITAIRSTAEILAEIGDIPEEKSKGFHEALFAESRSLSDAAVALTVQFDKDVRDRQSVSVARQVNDLIIGENNFFPDLEKEADRIRERWFAHEPNGGEVIGEETMRRVLAEVEQGMPGVPERMMVAEQAEDALLQEGAYAATRRFRLARRLCQALAMPTIARLGKDARLTSSDARDVAVKALVSYTAGALLFPYDRFLNDARKYRYDVECLARAYRASFEQIAHRLVTLRKPGNSGIPFAFLRTDPSGFLSKQFPLPGLLMPNSGHACPRWAIYAALQAPDRLVRQVVVYPDGSRFLFIAKASTKRVQTFTDRPVYSAIMLACNLPRAHETVYAMGLDLGDPSTDTPVGPTCALCVRARCLHRNSPTAAASAM